MKKWPYGSKRSFLLIFSVIDDLVKVSWKSDAGKCRNQQAPPYFDQLSEGYQPLYWGLTLRTFREEQLADQFRYFNFSSYLVIFRPDQSKKDPVSMHDCVRDQNFWDKRWAPSTFSSQTSLNHSSRHEDTLLPYITVIRQKGRKPQVKCLSWPSCENLALWALLPLDYSTIVFITINI